MSKKTIHFAHANGFPALTYKSLLQELSDEFEVNYTECLAHNPKFPVTDNWDFLKEELRTELKQRYLTPIIGLGHSLGGLLHILVSVENPELYEHIVLLDSPLISPISSQILKLAKITKLIDKTSLVISTKSRKNLWKTKQEAFEHFKNKPKFRSFDYQTLQNYVEHAIVAKNGGFELLFKPTIEAEIYKTTPHIIPKIYHKIKVPLSFIGGKDSVESRLAFLSYTKRHPKMKNFILVEGSHLFPLEKPKETASLIKKILNHNSF
ncbi:MAG: hypothetical protein N2Z23_05965 [Pyrinomonadaceae bacterium]|nr:hypothetical protein [Pyrinomonadaceae bacterium]MCX7639970.1 hypothetical protein [Pyrinomonadaceae bacterium]MDW8304142.1 alpha/beta hydrolase [Acidobacteriota bacterium]